MFYNASVRMSDCQGGSPPPRDTHHDVFCRQICCTLGLLPHCIIISLCLHVKSHSSVYVHFHHQLNTVYLLYPLLSKSSSVMNLHYIRRGLNYRTKPFLRHRRRSAWMRNTRCTSNRHQCDMSMATTAQAETECRACINCTAFHRVAPA